MRVVVTGGAGFLGSHLCDALRARGDRVVAVDNFLTGHAANVMHHADDPGFEFVEADVSVELPVDGAVDAVMHFASAASPPQYLAHPIETLDVGSLGTRHALDLARAHGARFLLASTSEIYGDPLVHPQPESYWGNVNSVGPRSVYDEAKRFAEAITMAYRRYEKVDVRIARIFNTYGPRMRLDDGRVVPTFVAQALRGEPITLFGDGSQTRSFCFVDDEVEGLWCLLHSSYADPVNIGNPHELTILEFAKAVQRLIGTEVPIVSRPLPEDDPKVRRPDIGRAKEVLGWEPKVSFDDGMRRTIAWFRERVRAT